MWTKLFDSRPLRSVLVVSLMALGTLMLGSTARAEEDCFNGPVPVPPESRAMFTIPPGQSVVLHFDFHADWENMVFVCDTLTGQRIMVKGNYFRDRSDWYSPIDTTRSLGFFVVAFHKTVSPDAGDAGDHPWLSSPLRVGGPFWGTGNGFTMTYGFNDGGGNGWDNSLVTANFIGVIAPH